MLKVAVRLAVDAVLVAVLLFTAAGTLAWWRAWVLLAVLLLIRVPSALAVWRVHPALLRERAGLPIHEEQPPLDRLLLVAVLATGFAGLPVIAGLDSFHWRVLPRPGPLLSTAGLALFALGWCIKGLALQANAFAATVVRVQRAQVVADRGVYAVVRHPFYAADPLILAGLGLWLESWLAALAAVIPVALMVVRLHLEERFLRREMPDYNGYATRVRYRLIPGVW